MVKLVNRAMMTTQTTGTGNVTLLAAVDGYHDFDTAGVGDGDTVPYTIEDGEDFEIGLGTYNSVTKVLTRVVAESSNNNAKINLSGDARVFVTVRAEDIIDLQTQIDGKSASGHGHAISDTSGLQAALDGKATSAQGAKADSAVQPVSGHGLYPDADKAKLAGIASQATKNATDAQLRDRSTHTGAQPISTVTGLQTALNDKLDADAAAVSADKLTTPRSIALSGDVSGSTSFDGSGNVTISATVANNSHTHTIANIGGLQSALDGKATSAQGAKADAAIPSAEKGALNGVATLDGTGKVPAAQLPSYVDDVEEYANFAAFPGTGEDGKIYVDEAQGDIYRWSGSAYIQINDAVSSADQATKLATARTISLGGDLTGSTSFDGSGNVTINAAVKDDSHSHVIANVDGLQDALDGKLATGAKAADANLWDGWDRASYLNQGVKTSDSPTFVKAILTSNGASDNLRLGDDVFIGDMNRANTFRVRGSQDPSAGYIVFGDGDGTALGRTGLGRLTYGDQAVFTDDYHPNADKLTTARTISLSGDVSGSASFDGSGNVTINATVADDSHNHTIANVDGLQDTLNSIDYPWLSQNPYSYDGTTQYWYLKIANASSGKHGLIEYYVSDDVNYPNSSHGYIRFSHWNNSSISVRHTQVWGDTANGLQVFVDNDDNLWVRCPGIDWGGATFNYRLLRGNIAMQSTRQQSIPAGLWEVPEKGRGYRLPRGNVTAGPTNTYDYNTHLGRTIKAGPNTVFHDGYHPNADKLTTGRTISLSGDASGSVSFDGSGNVTLPVTVANNSHSHTIGNISGLQAALDGKLAASANAVSASKLSTARTISLSGDASGSVSFDGSSNVSINVTVADDSHNHTIANVDGLQTALDGKATSAQGGKADTAYGWGDHAQAGYLTGVAWGDVAGKPATFTPSAHNHTLAQITDSGTAATLDFAQSGNASGNQVVKGDDTRLTDARTPKSHTHTKAQISDFNEGDYATSAQGVKADSAVQPSDLGTAAALDVPTSGDAAAHQVVKGNDSRLQQGGGGAFDATASGAITQGATVALNSDGTVSEVTHTGRPSAFGARADIPDAADVSTTRIVFDAASGDAIVIYGNGRSLGPGTARVCTITGQSLAFGGPVVFDSADVVVHSAIAAGPGKCLIAYEKSNDLYLVAGEYTGGVLSFGTPVNWTGQNFAYVSLGYDPVNDVALVAYNRTEYGRGDLKALSLSGTTLTGGSVLYWNSDDPSSHQVSYDPASGRFLVACHDDTGLRMIRVLVAGDLSVAYSNVSLPAGVDVLNYPHLEYLPSRGAHILKAENGAAGKDEFMLITYSAASGLFEFGPITQGDKMGGRYIFEDAAGRVVFASYSSIRVAEISGNVFEFPHATTIVPGGIYTGSGHGYDTVNDQVLLSVQTGAYDDTEILAAVPYTLQTNAGAFIGFAAEGTADGAVAKVSTFGSVVQAGSGFTTGADYSIEYDGSIVGAATSFPVIGKAVSPTKVLITNTGEVSQ